MNASAIESILDEKRYTLQLVKGHHDGKAVFAYMLFNKRVLEELKEKAKTEELNLAKYGITLYRGEGHNPSEEDEKKALEIFKQDHLAKETAE